MTITAPTALYRFFDAADCLLYVGITGNLTTRWRRHSETKTWWPNVASYTVELFKTRPEAEAAEKVAVRSEKPIHNKALVLVPFVATNPVPTGLSIDVPADLDLTVMLRSAENLGSGAEQAKAYGVILNKVPDLAEHVRQLRQQILIEMHTEDDMSWAEIGEAIGQHRTRAAQIARGVAGGSKKKAPTTT